MRQRTRATLAILATMGAAVGAVGGTAASAQGGGERHALSRRMRVSEGMNSLGAGAEAVARAHDSSAAEWKKVAQDPTAYLDVDGSLLFVDPVKPEAATTASVVAAAAPQTFPYAQTFLLHSNPASPRKLFIDFDGQTVAPGAWSTSTLVATPFSLDTDPAFSTTELDRIQAVWQIVAEDYAPFDIDVTTEDPGYAGINRATTTDTAFGTRVVVTEDATAYAATCASSCGGVAYVGVIDNTGANHDQYQPAWVFNTSLKGIAEAVSHEAGHNLGLSHDGTATAGYYTGQGAWAPIMGVAYSKPVGQWSRGEYSGANNTQDDFAVAQANAIPLRTDDFGSLAAPTSLASSPVLTKGLIGAQSDLDAFAFTTAGGTVAFMATPAAYAANLDIQLSLVDATGNVVVASDPPAAMVDATRASGLDAGLSATVAAGTYRIVVDGVGSGDPLTTGYSEYASVGPYTLSGTFPTSTNVAPTGVASVSQATGTAPVAVTFGSTGSSDPDGAIAAYTWTFSDGTTATGASVSKSFTIAGTYTATLRVTDNVGAVSAPSTVSVVVVTPVVTTTVKVQSMSISVLTKNRQRFARTVVTVTDSAGGPVSGVTVTGSYSGATSSTSSGTTDSTGRVTLQSSSTGARTGRFTFTVTNLTKTGVTYSAVANLISSVSIAY